MTHLGLPALDLKGHVGREAIERWWKASGAAVRLYRGVTAATLRSVLAEESRLDLAAVKAGGLHLARRATLLEARSRERAIRSATRSLVSGHLLLVGLQYGL